MNATGYIFAVLAGAAIVLGTLYLVGRRKLRSSAITGNTLATQIAQPSSSVPAIVPTVEQINAGRATAIPDVEAIA